MTRRWKRRWIALLLPLLALRAMLPAGYMPVAAEGQLHIVMCSPGLVVQFDSGTNGDHPAPEDGSCLFAHAAGFAPATEVAYSHLAPPYLSFDIPVAAQRQLTASPHRFAAARGPPHYS